MIIIFWVSIFHHAHCIEWDVRGVWDWIKVIYLLHGDVSSLLESGSNSKKQKAPP
jgi:hypothetical protein